MPWLAFEEIWWITENPVGRGIPDAPLLASLREGASVKGRVKTLPYRMLYQRTVWEAGPYEIEMRT